MAITGARCVSTKQICSPAVFLSCLRRKKKQKKEKKKKRLLVNAVKGINAYINYKYIYIYNMSFSKLQNKTDDQQ